MKLSEALRIGGQARLAFVGAGGKTAALFQLAHELDPQVILTTSTHLAVAEAARADAHFIIEGKRDLVKLKDGLAAGVTLATGQATSDQRLTGLSEEDLRGLKEIADAHNAHLLIEADGSRQLPLKAPAAHEPSIPAFVDTVVVVAGLSALGKPLSEQWVHRPEQFAALSGLNAGDLIEEQHIAAALSHASGGLKNIPAGARKIALLNQVQSPELEAVAGRIAGRLVPPYGAVISADLRNQMVLNTHEPVAGIVLAAGASERMETPKQLLEWRGRPFVQQVAQTALQAGLNPVVVVTGAYAEKVEKALEGLEVVVARNAAWKEGQSASVKQGLRMLPQETGAAIFLLVDQPQIPADLLRALVNTHASSLAPIVAPMVDGRRGNPVLFDRVTFPDFAGIEGDVGGRAVFSKHPVAWLPWLDASAALDVDTPADYQRLLNYED
jgi:molybdenum cofactor cytidylyltransferase